MPQLNFGEYRPDVSDRRMDYTSRLANVIARADGYGPVNALQEFTSALPAPCRGHFVGRTSDGSVAIFAGTADRLYQLDNTTFMWTDVSRGASAYTTLDPMAHWVFAQFGEVILATQRNDVMQAFNLVSDTEFDDLAGSPPQAGHIAVVGPFVVASDLFSDPFRIHWCGINNILNWTAGTGLSDFQDLPDGGRAVAVAEMSADVGLICQAGGFRRMVYAQGSELIFQIDRISQDRGLLAPYSLVAVNGVAVCLSTRGVIMIDVAGSITPIGEERIDRTLLADLDSGALHMVISAADPQKSVVLLCYKSQAGDAGQFDKALVYHTTLKRWSPATVSGEALASVSRPGLTLEGLDAIAPGALTITGAANNGSGLVRITVGSTSGLTTGDFKTISAVAGTTEANGTWEITVIDGTHFDLVGSTFANVYVSGGVVGGDLDALPFSLDEVSASSLPALSAISPDHKLAFFTGATLEARMETSEQNLEGYRVDINGIRPLTDAASVFGFVSTRDNMNAAAADGDESEMDGDGYCPLLAEGRYVRGVVRIPAGEIWSFATGIEADTTRAGRF